ncbi:hypothetical protein [Flavobacterium sp.]|uniref:hypothetical protein n=1 Tax=Flavobacterium sp. TaxID=239 RepID=UPI00261C532C|nr:hypothetical protein [Flavobacterium sp.]
MRTVALKSFVFIFFFGLLTSCSNDDATERFPLDQPSNIDAEDYDVYSVIIKSYNFSTIIIKQKAIFSNSSNDFIDELSAGNPGFEPQMVTTLFYNNQIPLFFDNSFDVSPTNVELISESELNYIFGFDGDSNNDWIQFYNTHPNTNGYSSFSAVAYNADKTKALVETGYYGAPLLGFGNLVYLEKVNGLWVIKKNVGTWIS